MPSVASSVSTLLAALVIFTLAVLPTLLLRKTLIKRKPDQFKFLDPSSTLSLGS